MWYCKRIPTAEEALGSDTVVIKARPDKLVREDQPFAVTLAGALRAYADELLARGPGQNGLIRRSTHKSDREDVSSLGLLLRLGGPKLV